MSFLASGSSYRGERDTDRTVESFRRELDDWTSKQKDEMSQEQVKEYWREVQKATSDLNPKDDSEALLTLFQEWESRQEDWDSVNGLYLWEMFGFIWRHLRSESVMTQGNFFLFLDICREICLGSDILFLHHKLFSLHLLDGYNHQEEKESDSVWRYFVLGSHQQPQETLKPQETQEETLEVPQETQEETLEVPQETQEETLEVPQETQEETLEVPQETQEEKDKTKNIHRKFPTKKSLSDHSPENVVLSQLCDCRGEKTKIVHRPRIPIVNTTDPVEEEVSDTSTLSRKERLRKQLVEKGKEQFNGCQEKRLKRCEEREKHFIQQQKIRNIAMFPAQEKIRDRQQKEREKLVALSQKSVPTRRQLPQVIRSQADMDRFLQKTQSRVKAKK